MSTAKKYSELAYRYASAMFDIANEKNQREVVLKALSGIHESLTADKSVGEFILSPLVQSAEKVQILQKTLAGTKVPAEVANFILLLAQKDRLVLLGEIVEAFQAREDVLNNVTRGVVKSPVALDEKQKQEVEKFINDFTKKKVVLTYENDKSLVGGLTANVGSLTFDDSVSSHLKRIKEDLNRSVV